MLTTPRLDAHDLGSRCARELACLERRLDLQHALGEDARRVYLRASTDHVERELCALDADAACCGAPSMPGMATGADSFAWALGFAISGYGFPAVAQKSFFLTDAGTDLWLEQQAAACVRLAGKPGS
jgi:hypothetical protein